MAYVKRGATLQDCEELATRLRSEDVKEVKATRPDKSIAESLVECIEVSDKTFAVMEDGIGCIALFGVRGCQFGGIPWFLSSDELLDKSPRKFLRQSKGYFIELTESFDLSFNYVSTTNTVAHRWLEWLGFTLDTSEANIKILNGIAFHPFTYRKKHNV